MERWAKRSAVRSLGPLVASLASFLLIVIASYFFAGLLADVAFAGMPRGVGYVLISIAQVISLWLSLFIAYLGALWVYDACTGSRWSDATPICGNCGYNLTGNVSGRCPECGMNSVAYVDWHFARREKIRRVKIGAMLLFGIPLSFLGPLLLSTMFWLAMTFGLRFSDFASGVRWLDVFVVLTAVMVPLLYRLETRTGGEYRTDLSDPGVATGQMALRAAVVGGPFAAGLLGVGTLVNARATSSAFVEFFLLGPRLVVSALRQFTLSRRLHLADRQRAAGIVALLLGRSDGVDTDHLLHEGEELGGLLPVLAYLVYYQWIGAGEKWRRVWLDSDTRRVISG